MSLMINIIALAIFAAGYFLAIPWLKMVGLFALSGALTNWLAVHMLFHKIPGLYGSGVIARNFEQFKTSILELMMQQFFNKENIEKFISSFEHSSSGSSSLDLAPVINEADLSPAFDSLVTAVEQSSFGSMLGMFGGTEALQPLRAPFITSLRENLITLTQSAEFQATLSKAASSDGMHDTLLETVNRLIEQRLDELTPEMVKTIIQEIIAKHLSWLVVWGGVFGGIIGAIASFV